MGISKACGQMCVDCLRPPLVYLPPLHGTFNQVFQQYTVLGCKVIYVQRARGPAWNTVSKRKRGYDMES